LRGPRGPKHDKVKQKVSRVGGRGEKELANGPKKRDLWNKSGKGGRGDRKKAGRGKKKKKQEKRKPCQERYFSPGEKKASARERSEVKH